MIDFSLELESVLETQKSIDQTKPDKIQQLISLGDAIREDFIRNISKLEKVRGTLP